VQFFDPSVTGDADFYEGLSAAHQYYVGDKWEHARALTSVKPGDRVLEVGCGTGGFLRQCRDAGASVLGLELNPAARTTARNAGLSVSGDSLVEVAQRRAAEFDIVCAFQVLEHVAAVGEFLGAMCACLRQDGKLIIAVPNRKSYLRLGTHVLEHPPHHVTLWSREVIRRLPAIFPLTLTVAEAEPLPDRHVQNWVDGHLSWLFPQTIRFFRPSDKLARVLAWYLHRSGLQRVCRGQGLYAEFVHRSRPLGTR